MLDSKTVAVIKSTVPILQTHGTQITRTFYKRLFAQHPELLNVFNQANQRQEKQQTALANALYAAAANIDQLGAILPVVRGIAHKHRALGVKAEHYPIVGQHLLAAMQEELGDALTPEIHEAWAQTYGVIAEIFIDIEAEMYRQAADRPGGWEGFRKFVVKRKQPESPAITSFYLEAQDGGTIADYLAGQYITVKVKPKGQPFSHLRHYSLSTAPNREYYRITVKREDPVHEKPAGYVSSYLHREIEEGDVLDITAPAGDFVLDDTSERPVVLIAGGVGLTPLTSMLDALVRQGRREVVFIHAVRSAEHQALRQDVAAWQASYDKLRAYTVHDESRADERCDKVGRVDLPWLKTVATPDADFYFCGPPPFMGEINEALKQWRVPDSRIHFEFFGPSAALA